MNAIKNHKGATIAEVLVAAGLMTIVLYALISVTTTQQLEVKSLSEKLAIVELERTLLANLSESCTAELSNTSLNSSAPYTVNIGSTIHLTQLHASSILGAPLLLNLGEQLTPSLKISVIDVENFTSAGVNKMLADLKIDFDQSKLVRALKPIILKLTIFVDGANKVVSCFSSQNTAGNCVVKTSALNPSPFMFGSGVGDISCDPGFRAISGGGSCSSGFGGQNFMSESKPISTNQWHVECCSYEHGTGFATCPQGNGNIYVICCP